MHECTHPVTQRDEQVRIGAPGSVGVTSKAHHHGCDHFIVTLIREEGVAHHVRPTLPIKVFFELQIKHARVVMDTHNLLGSVQGNGVLLGSAPALKQITHTCTGRLLRNVKLGADMSTPMARLIHKCTVAEITADHATGRGGLTPLSSWFWFLGSGVARASLQEQEQCPALLCKSLGEAVRLMLSVRGAPTSLEARRLRLEPVCTQSACSS